MPSPAIDSLISDFGARASAGDGKGGLLPGDWSEADWAHFFNHADFRSVAAGQALISRGEHGRTLYFVLRGSLEVIHSGNGVSLGPLSKATAGMVLGEVSFFDGQPRSRSVWAITDSEVATMTMDQFTAFESHHPRLGRDLLFALGRVLAARLRSTNAQLDGNN